MTVGTSEDEVIRTELKGRGSKREVETGKKIHQVSHLKK